MNLDGYDFLDFGASKGGSIDFARRRLGGNKGLGIDVDPKKVKLMSEAGYDCVQADATELNFPPDSVRFVIMSHFLEHLPDLSVAEAAIRSAADVASDFLFIQGPYFDADEYLRDQGLKFYWSDWHGHPCHLTTSQLREILLGLGLEDYVIMGCGAVTDSDDPTIHPLDSPIDQHAYDPRVHREKPFVRFPRPIYKDIVCCVRLRPIDNWADVLRAHNKECEQIDASIEAQVTDRPQKPFYARLASAILPRAARTRLVAGRPSEERSKSASTRSRNKIVAPPLPTFLIIGAQKSATRWLRTNLGAHPQVFTADTESHFFSRNRFFHRGLDWYRTHFEGWDGEPIVGEATPGYMMWLDDPAKMAGRIDEYLPDVRLLALLRNPVDRAYSAFIHHMRRGRIPADADLLGWVRSVALEDDKQGFKQGLIAGGWYAASLTPYFERFGERLQVFLHDDVIDHPKRVYRCALEHIGASPDFVPPELERVVFSNSPPKPSAYHEGKGGRRKLTSEERAELYEYFRHDIDQLEELLGRDLSIWRPSSS